MHEHPKLDWKKYVIVFFITSTLFGSVLWLSSYLNSKKTDELRTVQDKIYVDLLSSEAQFSLLQESSCKDVNSTVLSSELNSLSDKITYSESNIGTNNTDVISLKKYYSILEIKDYLLMKNITKRCGEKPVFILYFYSNDSCTDCTKQGYVLSDLHEKYPSLRVYSFDYNLDLSAIKAMISMYSVPDKLPAMVVNGKVYSGFKTADDMKKLVPEMVVNQLKEDKKKAAAESATQTTNPSSSTTVDTQASTTATTPIDKTQTQDANPTQ
jgi:hypothetical protein